MKIDDVSLTIFTWDNIPATNYHTGTATVGDSNLGLLRIHTDAGWRATLSWARPPIRRRWMGRN